MTDAVEVRPETIGETVDGIEPLIPTTSRRLITSATNAS